MSNPIVTMKTNQGTMKIELYPETAPNTGAQFYCAWFKTAFMTD